MRTCAVNLSAGDAQLAHVDAVGPVDLALAHPGALVLGAGPLAAPDVPGSHRLVVCGRSDLWDGFFVSTIGSAALALRAVGLDALALIGRAPEPSALVVTASAPPRLAPVGLSAWEERGVYGMIAALSELGSQGAPRVLATGPGARDTLFGAIASASGQDGLIDTWAGRGGFGSRLFQRHGLVGIVLDAPREPVARPHASPRQLQATQKYRYHPVLGTGGTLGANLTTLREKMLFMNARSVRLPPEEREKIYEELVLRRYLAQHNAALKAPGASRDCGEWCPALCKKVTHGLKKDFQPYAAFGPNLGVFDQSAAEALADASDALGLDAVEAGALLGWRMECEGLFDGPLDPKANAEAARRLLGDLDGGGLARAALAAPPADRDLALFVPHGAGGIAPAQYWVPGMLAPVAVSGKYYVDYAFDWRAPRALGRACAERFVAELALDNLGVCRFQREWAEADLPSLLARAGLPQEAGLPHHRRLARRLQAMATPAPPGTARAAEFLAAYCEEVRRDGPPDAELDEWAARHRANPRGAARAHWDEMRTGIAEGLA